MCYSAILNGQIVIKAEADKWTAQNIDVTYKDSVIHVMRKSDAAAILWLNDIIIRNGIIDLDIRGNDKDGQSFLGVAFHGISNENYDAVYFRPFNFRNSEKMSRSIQYISKPDYDWDNLREKHPGKYEDAVKPVPDPNDWFHAKIVIQFPIIEIFINDSKEPSFMVEKISKRRDGKIGLWIDSKDGWFKNMVVTPAAPSQ